MVILALDVFSVVVVFGKSVSVLIVVVFFDALVVSAAVELFVYVDDTAVSVIFEAVVELSSFAI